MGRTLHLSLDLGKDSLKIAFAYSKRSDGEVVIPGDIVYGKFGIPGYMLKIGFPAVACHNERTGEWVLGDKVDREFDGSFGRVVRIKDLLSLLQYDECAPYYGGKTQFPRFYFPSSREYKLIENFPDSVKFGDTFDGGVTPKEVCERYFKYIAGIVAERTDRLTGTTGAVFSAIKLSLVHPPKVGKRYLDELSSLIQEAFGSAPEKILSSTKSLGMYAKHRGIFDEVSETLIVDMGEEDISVARVFTGNDSVIIDGEEGHSDPLPLGGNDIDYAIAEMLKEKICRRAPFGSCFADDESAEREEPLYEKQYLFMKSVKSAKIALSKAGAELGAMIGIYYETYKQGTLMREDLARCLGTDVPYGDDADKTKIAPRIAEYVINELAGEVNIDITNPGDGESYGKVILSGGLAECYSLKEYLAEAITSVYPGVGLVAFDESDKSGDEFAVQPFEDSAYAPAVGGALVSLKNETIITGLSLSYATWGTFEEPGGGTHFVISIFVDRGTHIEEGDIFSTNFFFQSKGNPNIIETVVEDEEIYSAAITSRELMKYNVRKDLFFKKKYRGRDIECVQSSHNGGWYLKVEADTPDEIMESATARAVKLRSISGGKGTKIMLGYVYKDKNTGKTVTRKIDRLKSAVPNQKPHALEVSENVIVEEKGRLRISYTLLPPERQASRVYLGHFEGDPLYVFSEVNVSQMYVDAPGIRPIIPTISE